MDVRHPDSGRLLYSLPEQASTVWWLAWGPDSRRLVVSRANGEIAVWNMEAVEGQLAELGLKP